MCVDIEGGGHNGGGEKCQILTQIFLCIYLQVLVTATSLTFFLPFGHKFKKPMTGEEINGFTLKMFLIFSKQFIFVNTLGNGLTKRIRRR